MPQSGAVDLSFLERVVGPANDLSDEFSRLSDEQLRERLEGIPRSFAASDSWVSVFLAVVRELAHRRIGLRPFDVQLQAAAAMLRGISVELATGEGKTLIGAMVAVGLAHEGLSVHVLSANDYLAQRDADWMGPLLEAAGVSVSAVTSRTPKGARQPAYRANVVYVPVTTAGFDVLRDRLVLDERDLVGVGADAAILDEADAVLLDEARVPLVLAGASMALRAQAGNWRNLPQNCRRASTTRSTLIDAPCISQRRACRRRRPGSRGRPVRLRVGAPDPGPRGIACRGSSRS